MLSLIPGARNINWLIGSGCVALMAAALFMEHAMELEPCPLCIFQRLAVISVALAAFIGAIHNPANLGIKIYGGLVVLAAAIGSGLASRQLWLQSLPEDQVPSCGAGLDYLLDVFPLTEVVQMVLSGDGTCAEVVLTVLGLSIPGWTLIGFLGLNAMGIFQVIRPGQPTPSS